MQRVKWIDIAKGIGVILVTIGHVSFCPEYINVWLGSFHMPLFFILAGITYNAEKYSDFKLLLKDKIKSLIVPYFIFSFINLIWDLAWDVIYFFKDDVRFPINETVKHIIGIFLQIRTTAFGPGVWFIPCIFVAFILLRFIVWTSTTKNNKGGKFRAILLACLSLIVGCIYCEYVDIKLPWGIDAAFVAVFFMTLGNLLREKLFRVVSIQ